MAKLTIIVGLPGSGKSSLIQRLKPEYAGVCAEDWWKDSNGTGFMDSQHYGQLVQDLRAGRNCIIADIEFCDPARSRGIETVVRNEALGTVFDWQFFENDPEHCRANALRRNRRNVNQELETILRLTRVYRPPHIRPVYRPDSV